MGYKLCNRTEFLSWTRGQLEAEVKRLQDKLSFAISKDGLDCPMAEFEQQYEAAEAKGGE